MPMDEIFYYRLGQKRAGGGGSGGGTGGGTGGFGDYTVTFMSADGATQLYVSAVKSGGNCPDPVAKGYIPEPTKEGNAQYKYTYTGWATALSGSANTEALNNVTSNRIVYAAFAAEVQTYTVYWYNGDELLETDFDVPYGTTPTYDGADPVYNGDGDPEDYEWAGWTPKVAPVTESVKYYAVYKSPDVFYTKLIDRSITDIESPTPSVRDYAFYECASLTIVDLSAVASIGNYAFRNCVRLKTLILRNTETICTLGPNYPFESTPIKGGSGYIYVPRKFLNDTDSTMDYRRATNWSKYAARFRALEDYTVDGTTTGEFDVTKV